MNNLDQFITQYENALSTQNWENVKLFIHENCVATFTEGTFIGKLEVEKAFRKTFDLINDEKYKIKNLHWIVKTSEFAVLSFTYHWSGYINGDYNEGSGRGTSSLTNENGRWQIIAEHLGPNPKK